MINVNQITAQLAKMPDNALQQYAAMHKDDPYTVSLALSESNRRKAMRAGAVAGAPQQPTVVDQDIAGMAPPAQQLPEDVGIGQLPAQNMQKMAGGGIVAFDEGGEVPGYAGGGIPYAAYGFGNTQAAQPTPAEIAEYNRQQQQGFTGNLQEFLSKIRSMLPTDAPQLQPQVSKQIQYAEGVNMRPTMAADPRLLGTPSAEQSVSPQAVGTTPLTASTGQPAAQPAAQPAPQGGIAGGYEQKFLDALSKGETDKATRMKEVTDIDAPVLEKWKSLVDDQKSKLKSDKEENFYMSLIQGGLAAAGASGPNALQNLAQGFEKGAAHYGEGLKDLRKAAQENEKMQLSMAQYEATGKKDALKSYYEHADKVEGYKAAGLATIFGHQISAAGSVAAAGAGANAQRNLMEALGNAPESSPLRKGFELTKQEGRIPMMYDAYVKAASDPMKGEDFLRKYPTFDVYKAGMGGAGSGQFIQMPTGAAPSTAVLPRKN